MYSTYWWRTPHYDLPACFSCSVFSFEDSGLFSCFSAFFNFNLMEFLHLSHMGFFRHGCRGSRAMQVESDLQWLLPSARVELFLCYFFCLILCLQCHAYYNIGLCHFLSDILFHCINVSQLIHATVSRHSSCLQFLITVK